MVTDQVKHVHHGHYHDYAERSNNVTIVGAPMQHTWADSRKQRGWVVYDIDIDQEEFIKSNAPKFIEINCTDSLEHHNVFISKEVVNGNYIRIKNYTGAIERLRKSLVDVGAASVEFCLPGVDYNKIVDINPSNFSLEPIIQAYEDNHKIDGLTKQVGKQLRSRSYEAPVLKD